ncbi:MAG: hypothetical protein HONBIEJF_00741 [Fimbriimonadaceae bacterium]|nr:hypothetical protein [Fimbriimonadaceae bacterium]
MTDDDPHKKLEEALAEASASEVLIASLVEELKHLEGAEAEAKLAELEARLEQIADRMSIESEAPEPIGDHPDIGDRLKQIEARANSYRVAQVEAGHKTDQVLKQDAESYRGLGVGLTIAYTILGFPMIGIGIGWLIDRNNPGGSAMGIGAILGSFIGVGAAIWMLSRHSQDRN